MLNLQQQLKLQQKLSPQQIQYIKLLQLNNLALEQRLLTELQANPMLEEADAFGGESQTEEDDEAATDDQDDEFDWEELLPSGDEDFRGHRTDPDQDRAAERPLAAETSMAEHLNDQLSLLSLSEDESLIAEHIIGSIEEDGYLRRDLLSIVDDLMFTYGARINEDDVERVLARIQRLDPVGIAARSLQECLTVQLMALPERTPGRTTALALMARCYEDFTMKRFSRIKQTLGVDDRILKRAFDLVRRLNPKPGEGTITAQENYITPDFEVRAHGQKFHIALIGYRGPRVRISREYHQLLQRLTPKSGPVPRTGPQAETRQYLKGRFESARWFIDAINQRRRTLLAVMEAIVARQRDFFLYGPGHLKPMILMNIAQDVEMDISTISRVVADKYVQCDWGILGLKHFFSEGVRMRSGEMVSNKEVKAIIRDIIRQESKTAPLSDRKLAEVLDARGFIIARRTVSKYREQLGLPVARLRRELVLTPVPPGADTPSPQKGFSTPL